MRAVLEATGSNYVGVDVSTDMLRAGATSAVLQGDAMRLPFRDGTFTAVVCVRLLHHLADRASRTALVRELVRVSAGLVVLSFWDAASLHAWRRRAGLRRSVHPDRRTAVSRREIEELFEAAGAPVVGYRHSLRFVSPQTFAAACKVAVRR